MSSYDGIQRIWPFPGGIHPPERKAGTRDQPIRPLPLPKRLYLSMEQSIGVGRGSARPAQPCVSVGQHVLKGELIARDESGHGAPLHAPTSGTIVAITEHPLCHPSGLSGPTVVIESDGEERWIAHAGTPDFRALEKTELLRRIRAAGILGLGGAGFPTATKLATDQPVHTLILNGAECEPYICCDERLMRERAAEVVEGGRILMQVLGVELALIGVEDSMSEAIEALWSAIRASGDERLHVELVPTQYPAGGERQLTYLLSGQEVPSGRYPEALGYVVQNVMTAAAVYRAVVLGEPLLSRIVTVAGEGVANPGNYEVLLGTPIADLLTATRANERHYYKLILGGPMMGFTLPDASVPISKIANCVIVAAKSEIVPPAPERACIRCAWCVPVCPVNLLPQQLFWFARSGEREKAERHKLFDCIECGACAYVCPSNIPLVAYYRAAKGEIRAEQAERAQAEHARVRYEARKARLERDEQEKAERYARAAAVRKAAPIGVQVLPAETAPVPEPTAVNEPPTDPAAQRKAEIAEAIARARARKAEMNSQNPPKDTP